MKAAVALILALGLLSVGLMAGANAVIHSQVNQVTVQAETLAGDPAAAEGLTLSLPAECQSQLFWDFSFPATRPEQLSTSFSFDLFPRPFLDNYVFPPLSIYIPTGSTAYYSSGYTYLEQDWNSIPWSAAIQQVEKQTQPGQTLTRQLYAAQISPYFPINVTMSVQYGLSERAIASYFSIPIPEDYQITVTVTKDSSGGIMELSVQDDERYSIDIGTYAYDTGGSLVFTLANSFWNNETNRFYPLDGSHIDGGWGIYRFTYDARTQQGQTETLYSLPEGSMIQEFWGDGTEYFLLTIEEHTLRLRIFDRSVQLKQTIDLLEMPEGTEYQQVFQGEGYFVPMTYGIDHQGSQFAVVSRQDGAWQLDFTHTAQLEAVNQSSFSTLDSHYRTMDMAYDGTSLAIRDVINYTTTGFYLAVYSRDGLDYLGSYTFSLNPAHLTAPPWPCEMRFPILSPLLSWGQSSP